MSFKKNLFGIVLVVTLLLVFSFGSVAMAATNTGSDDFSDSVKFGDLWAVVSWSVNYTGEYVVDERVEGHNVSGCISSLPYNYYPYCNASCHYKEDGDIIETIGVDDWTDEPALCQDHAYNYWEVRNVYYDSSSTFYADILTVIDTVGGDRNPIGTLQVYY
ncbi:MAG: hypothetical protein K9L17_13350 [Clostridiales bacterium]|nr:hypothetical protein [Clostridiales bacterium]MCF8023661.1 hypothetical protein [Clostridiales bacterium]